jgi:hypothetical protein
VWLASSSHQIGNIWGKEAWHCVGERQANHTASAIFNDYRFAPHIPTYVGRSHKLLSWNLVWLDHHAHDTLEWHASCTVSTAISLSSCSNDIPSLIIKPGKISMMVSLPNFARAETTSVYCNYGPYETYHDFHTNVM